MPKSKKVFLAVILSVLWYKMSKTKPKTDKIAVFGNDTG
jgi:hypothetical protein